MAPVSLATFNCGIDQNMLTGSNLPTHQHNLRRITKNALYEGCHVLAFCEVGGHKQGLQAASIVPSQIVKDLLDKDRCIAASLEAYMAVWDKGDLQETDGIAVRLMFEPTCVELRLLGRDLAVEPRVVIFEFEVTASEHPQKMGRLVLGVLHIRLTSDTCVQPRPRTGIRVIGHLPGSLDLQKLDSVIGPAWDRGLRPLDRPWKICSSSSSRSPARPVPVLGNRATVSELPLQLGTARRRPLTRARG